MPAKRKEYENTSADAMMIADFQMQPLEGVRPGGGRGNIEDSDSSDEEAGQIHHHVALTGENPVYVNHDPNFSASATLEALERENENLFLSSKALKTARENFPWLMAFGRPCVSDRRMVMSPDEPGRRKCRKLYCLICARFNHDTPWATVKARKFEKKYFVDHEASMHHIKAVQNMKEGGFGNADPIEFLDPAVFTLAEVVYPELMPNQVPSSEANYYVISTDDYPQIYLGGGGDSNPMGVAMTNNTDEEQAKRPKKRKRSPKEMMEGGSDNASTGLQEMSGYDDKDVKIKFMPAWLKTAGRLRCSGRTQALLPSMTQEEQAKIKKKYRDCYCALCAEFQPGSPWSQVRGRKYEKALLIQHERSICHRKAVSIQSGEPFEAPETGYKRQSQQPMHQLQMEPQQASVEDVLMTQE